MINKIDRAPVLGASVAVGEHDDLYGVIGFIEAQGCLVPRGRR